MSRSPPSTSSSWHGNDDDDDDEISVESPSGHSNLSVGTSSQAVVCAMLISRTRTRTRTRSQNSPVSRRVCSYFLPLPSPARHRYFLRTIIRRVSWWTPVSCHLTPFCLGDKPTETQRGCILLHTHTRTHIRRSPHVRLSREWIRVFRVFRWGFLGRCDGIEPLIKLDPDRMHLFLHRCRLRLDLLMGH